VACFSVGWVLRVGEAHEKDIPEDGDPIRELRSDRDFRLPRRTETLTVA
jgi:hypothetical protein